MLAISTLLPLLLIPVQDHELVFAPGTSVAADFGGRHGEVMVPLDDWDNDGVVDFLVRDYAETTIRYHSGHTGTLLTAFPQQASAWRLTRVGDVNGDGIEDFFDGVNVCSGLDGSVVHTVLLPAGQLLGPQYASPFRDIDGDGAQEFLVGTPVWFGSGGCGGVTIYTDPTPAVVELRDGATGATLLSITSPGLQNFGSILVRLDDIDGDGADDIGVGCAMLDDSLFPGTDGFHAFSSATGQPLWSTALATRAVERVGDIDGDGVTDLAVGGLNEVVAISGTTGAALWAHGVQVGVIYGAYLDTFDFTGDGFPDVVVGSPGVVGTPACLLTSFGYVKLLDGLTGQVVAHIDGPADEPAFGAGVEVLGDTNGDGAVDLLLGASSFSMGGATRARVISSVPLSLSSDQVELSTSAGGQQQFDLDLAPTHAGQVAILLGSVSGYQPGTLVGGQVLPVNLDSYLLTTLWSIPSRIVDATGGASWSLSLPPGSLTGFTGLVLHHAALVLDPLTGVVTAVSVPVPTVFGI